MKIGFIGLGKLGLPIAETISHKHEVYGYDIKPRKSQSVQIVNEISEVAKKSEIIFIAVETPHAPEYDGSKSVRNLPLKDFDYSIVKTCLKSLEPHLKQNQIVVLISTVLPGTTRRELAQLTKAMLIYNPYLIAMGTEQWDFLNPEMVIIGSEDGAKGIEKLCGFYKTLMSPQTRYVLGTWEEAEATKIFYNTFISAKLSLVNMIQDVAMKIGYMNVDIVTRALAQSTQRIMSSAYMVAGMGDGGPCHPRDNIALRWLSQELELGYDLFSAVIDSREAQAKNLAQFLVQLGSHIIILGKAFKPGVSYITGSYSLLVAEFVKELGGRVEFYDPRTQDIEISPTEESVFLIGFWDQWLRDFKFTKNSIIVDPWRKLSLSAQYRVIHYGNSRLQMAQEVNPIQINNNHQVNI